MELIHAASSIDDTDSITGSSKLIVTTDLDTLLDWFPDAAQSEGAAHSEEAEGDNVRDTETDDAQAGHTENPNTDDTDDPRGTGTDGPHAEEPRTGPTHGPRGRRRGSGCGITLTGRMLDAGTLRRLACEAQLIPAVLGTESEPLDVGRGRRLIRAGLRAAVVLRDRHCSFPGCTRPPQWCEVHHVIPWLAGGPTSLANSALLCCRHHAIVHRDELTALVRPDRVTWDLTPGRMTRAGP